MLFLNLLYLGLRVSGMPFVPRVLRVKVFPSQTNLYDPLTR